MQRQDNIPLQNTAELQNGMSMSKNGTDGMGSDIPFDAADYYVDDMAYAATNMGFDIPVEPAAGMEPENNMQPKAVASDTAMMGFDISASGNGSAGNIKKQPMHRII